MDTIDTQEMSGGSEITPQGMNDIKGALPWMKFMAILGFIFAALMAIGGLMFLASGSEVEGAAIFGVIYIVFAGVYFYVSYILWQWASNMSHFVIARDSRKLEAAFSKQKAWWMAVGIFTIAAIVLGIIAAIAGVGFMQTEWGTR